MNESGWKVRTLVGVLLETVLFGLQQEDARDTSPLNRRPLIIILRRLLNESTRSYNISMLEMQVLLLIKSRLRMAYENTRAGVSKMSISRKDQGEGCLGHPGTYPNCFKDCAALNNCYEEAKKGQEWVWVYICDDWIDGPIPAYRKV